MTTPPNISSSPDSVAPADDTIFDTTQDTFARDVIEASQKVPVLVHFWAPASAPCQQLTPVLEKAVTNAKGKVRLAKVNIDENPAIAQQLKIQSLPAVFVFQNGQPVDGFIGAISQSKLYSFLEGLTGQSLKDPIQERLEQARNILKDGKAQEAAQIFSQVLQKDAQNTDAAGGLAQCYTALGDNEKAREILEPFVAQKEQYPAIGKALDAIVLQEKAIALGDEKKLRTSLAQNGKDHQTRFDLALVLHAAQKSEEALDHLLTIIEQDKNWNNGIARDQLLQLFESYGQTSPLTVKARRRLSSILFR